MSLEEAGVLAPDSTGAEVSSPATGDGGYGGTDAGASPAGDGGGAQPIESTQATEQPTDATTAEGQQPTDTTLPEYVGQAPVALPDAIRKLQADKDLGAHPLVSEALKQVQSAYDRLNAYTLHLPTVADAKKFAESFPGGLQDAIQAQQRAQQLDESDGVFYSRDPAQHRELASTWAKDDPEAFGVLTRSGLEVYAETNPEGYQALGNEILEQTLGNMLATAYQTGNQEAAARISQVHQDIFGRKPGEQSRQDPRDAKHQQREQAQTQKEQQFQQRVAKSFADTSNSQAGTKISTAIDGVLKTALNGVKITPQARQRIAKEVYDEINTRLLGDRALDNQLKAIIQAGSRSGNFSPQQQQQWINAIYAKGRNLVQTVATEKVNEWTVNFLGVKKADTTKREQAGARTDVTGGGSPNLGMTPLTGDKILNMTDEDFRNYKGPIHPEWRKQMQEARFGRK